MSNSVSGHEGFSAVRTQRFSGRRIGRAVVLEVGGNVAVKAVTALQTIVLARLFAPAELGAWNTALLVIAAITTMASLGLDQYLLVAEKENYQARLDTAFTLTAATALGAMLLLLAASGSLANALGAPEASARFRFLSPMILGIALTLPAAGWERQLHFGLPKIPSFSAAITLMGVAVVLRVGFGWGVEGLFVAQLCSFVVSVTTLWMLAPARPRLVWHPREVRAQIAFGTPFFVAGIAAFVSGQGDDLLVRFFHGDEALGLYVVAFYLPGYLLTLVEMIARVAVPALAPLRGSPRELKEVFSLFSRYIATVAVGAGTALALFAQEVVWLLYGEAWLSIVPLVRLFAVGFVLRGATGFHWHILVVLFQRTRYLLGASLASAVFMLVVAPPLIWKFGLMGGAIYSFVQLGVMTPLVRFPLIRQTIGDLSYLRGTVPSLCAGGLAIVACGIAGRLGASAGLTACTFFLGYVALLLWFDSTVYRHVRRVLSVVRIA